MKRTGIVLLAAIAMAATAAPWLAPNPPDRQFPDHLYAPPTRVRFLGGPEGSVAHIWPQHVTNRLERVFVEDRSAPAALRFFSDGKLLAVEASGEPLLLLGADSYGRDVFSRLLYASRVSLLLAALATICAVALGSAIGALAGYTGGLLDDLLSRAGDFLLVLPTMYVVLALRASMPLVLPAAQVFALLTAIFALLGWPVVARVVRAIVRAECGQDYVMAGRAIGAGPARLICRHLLPAARGQIGTQATLLLPAFLIGEATLSYVGLGFPPTVPTWGTMLQEAGNIALIGDVPWLLAPAAAIFVVVLAVNVTVQGSGHTPVQLTS